MEAFQRLEAAVGEWMGFASEQVVACSSGTAALHLALESLQLPPMSKVVVPDYCMIACARAVTLAGLQPVFVDCDDSLNIDIPKMVKQILPIKPWPSALLVVHTYGRRVPTEELHNSSEAEGGIPIIEDMAELHGIKPHDMTAAACWSFYKNKVVAGEEGGAVAFKNVEHAKLARQLRSLGFTDAHDFYHVPRGHNYRMSNVHASIILEHSNDYCSNPNALDQLEDNLDVRRVIENWYNVDCPAEWMMLKRDVPWVYDVRLPFDPYAQDLVGDIVRRLNKEGIAAREGFKRMTAQAEYCVPGEGFRKAAEMGRRIFYLPISPGITSRDDCRRAFEIAKMVVEEAARP